MLARTAEKQLHSWLHKKSRKPLVLRGARQVGKSTLVRSFAAKNNLTLNEVNLERNLFLDPVFQKLDTNVIIRELEALVGRSILTPDAILFLDEIQATPNALQALRYLFEDFPNLPVIAAGSLLEFTLADHHFSMPVGRIEYFHLYPMSFREYLNALDPDLLPHLDRIDYSLSLPTAAHMRLSMKLREYFFTGGLPEAVNVYVESKSLAEVSAIHRNIINTFQDDFAKYSKHNNLLLLQKTFNHIPRSLGKKIKYSNISRENRTVQVKNAISLLTKARICHQIFHSHCSGLPLHADIVDNIYKLIFLDIGLVNTICGIDWLTISSFLDHQLVNEGALAEQFIGQHLINLSDGLDTPHLHYWHREGKSTNAEVDYVVTSGNQIVPVEVKAGKSGSLKSLQQFVNHKKTKLAVRFDLNLPSLQTVQHTTRTADGDKKVTLELLSLPLYAVEELPRILKMLGAKTDK